MNDGERLTALEARVHELEDRQAILDCISRNSRGNDRCDLALTTSSYHGDGLQDMGKEQVAGADYGAHANRAHQMLFEATLHNLTTHSCEIDGAVAHAETYSLGLFTDKGAETGRLIAGRYLDRLEKRDGAWRIVLRRVTVEVVMEGKAMLPANTPLVGSNYLRGERDRSDPSFARPLVTGAGTRW